VFSNIWAGGGIQTGGILGTSDKRGAEAIKRGCASGDFLAAIYHHPGIDYAKEMINNFTGRLTAIVNDGRPIPELSRA